MIEQRIKALLPESVRAITVIGDLPSAPPDVIAIMLYNGSVNSEYFVSGTVYAPIIKFVLRNQSYEQAQQHIEIIKRAIHRYHDDYFISILMQGYPMYLGKDAQKFHEFQVVFSIKVKE